MAALAGSTLSSHTEVELLLSLEVSLPHPELGQEDVLVGNLSGIRKHTGEVGTSQGRAQLLQHQGLPQPGALAPTLPHMAAAGKGKW